MDRLITSDIYYGAYLLSQGRRLERYVVKDGSSGRKLAFEFSGPGLQGLMQEYLSGDATVNLKSLRSSLKHLKDIVFNEPTLTLKERHQNGHPLQ